MNECTWPNTADQQPNPHKLRSWRPSSHDPNQDQSAKRVVTLSPIAASSKSKVKLSAFLFDGLAAIPTKPSLKMSIAEDNKENAVSRGGKEEYGSQTVDSAKDASQEPSHGESRNCPQTPIGRLPLAELIAGHNDGSSQNTNFSPADRVLWNVSPRSSDPANLLEPPTSPKKRKRAHSLSSDPSSLNETSSHFTTKKPSMNLRPLQQTLKTPQADPAKELWSMYSLDPRSCSRRSPTEARGIPVTDFVELSSPQTPAYRVHVKGSGDGLRRSFSCGMEWPTSIAKRRKIETSGGGQPSQLGFAIVNDMRENEDQKRVSRLSDLVDKMHKRLIEPENGPDISSSSPLPRSAPFSQRSQAQSERDESASEKMVMKDVEERLRPAGSPSEEESPGRQNTVAKEDILSEFGDDDLELSMLEVIDTNDVTTTLEKHATILEDTSSHTDASINRPPSFNLGVKELPSKAPGTVNAISEPGTLPSEASHDKRQSSSPKPSASTPFRSPQKVGVEKPDEFDDDDETYISPADLEDIISTYDQNPRAPLQSQSARFKREGSRKPDLAPRTTTSGNSKARLPEHSNLASMFSDDEFGDDINVDDFDAACEQATQEQKASYTKSVCITHPV